MAVYGKCPDCGSETRDYSCLICIDDERRLLIAAVVEFLQRAGLLPEETIATVTTAGLVAKLKEAGASLDEQPEDMTAEEQASMMAALRTPRPVPLPPLTEERRKLVADAIRISQQTWPQPLNHDHDLARSVHRVIRAMHDGECPACHKIFMAEDMRPDACFADWQCPSCGFAISTEEAKAGLALFAPFMEQNVAVFEKWRATLSKKQPSPVAPVTKNVSHCNGCGVALKEENAWMVDGCPCNAPAGCNAGNLLIVKWRKEDHMRAKHGASGAAVRELIGLIYKYHDVLFNDDTDLMRAAKKYAAIYNSESQGASPGAPTGNPGDR